jgi:NitT/TauT family transport system ATP-binding protein
MKQKMNGNYRKRSASRYQAVRIRQLKKVFSPHTEPVVAVENFSVDIEKGEVAVILGPSGCGKSTVIRMIAGLEKPTAGTLLVNNKTIEKPLLECCMVFQSYTSFPWLTVIDNIAFGLRYTHKEMSPEERNKKARHFAKLVELEKFENAYINTLSGGMKQRVAIASALATDPEILLMDEPFGALDSQTRMVMQEHLLKIVENTDKTVIFVTHDIEEALLLGDRIYVCTARPASILAEFDVPFPHPRDHKTRNRKDFFEMKHKIFNLLRDHVVAQMLIKKYARRKGKKNA